MARALVETMSQRFQVRKREWKRKRGCECPSNGGRTIYVCISEKERIINGKRANERNRMKGNIRVNRTMYVYALGNVAHLTEIEIIFDYYRIYTRTDW